MHSTPICLQTCIRASPRPRQRKPVHRCTGSAAAARKTAGRSDRERSRDAVGGPCSAPRRARRSRRAPSPGTGRPARRRSRSTARPARSPSSPPRVGEHADDAADVLDDRRLDAFGRLVEDQQLRARRRARGAIASCCCWPPERSPPRRLQHLLEHREQLEQLGRHRARRRGCVGQAHAQVLLDRQAGEDLAPLRHVADAARARARTACACVMSSPSKRDRCPCATGTTPIRLFSSVVLPTPLRPRSAVHLAGRHLEARRRAGCGCRRSTG